MSCNGDSDDDFFTNACFKINDIRNNEKISEINKHLTNQLKNDKKTLKSDTNKNNKNNVNENNRDDNKKIQMKNEKKIQISIVKKKENNIDWNKDIIILSGDAQKMAIKKLVDNSIQTIITSPPYFQCRKYDEENENELGQEKNPQDFINHLCDIFFSLYSKLKENGCLWVNIGDSIAKKDFSEMKIKKGEQMLIPSLFALEMRRRGWLIQQDIIWAKKNPMPISVYSIYFCQFLNVFLNLYSWFYLFFKGKKTVYSFKRVYFFIYKK